MAKGIYRNWLSVDRLLLLTAWARDGLTNEQIAHNIGITATTLYDWKNRYPEISEALKSGKEVVDIEVENALLKRALGYEYIEEKIETNNNNQKTIKTLKYVPGDTTAQIFWLKNRKPNEWRDKPYSQDETNSINCGVIILPAVLPEPPPPDTSDD